MENHFIKLGMLLILELVKLIRLPTNVTAMAMIVRDNARDLHANMAMQNIGAAAAKVFEAHSWIMCSDMLPPVGAGKAEEFLVVYQLPNSSVWNMEITIYEPDDEYYRLNSGFAFGSQKNVNVLCWRHLPEMPQMLAGELTVNELAQS